VLLPVPLVRLFPAFRAKDAETSSAVNYRNASRDFRSEEQLALPSVATETYGLSSAVYPEIDFHSSLFNGFRPRAVLRIPSWSLLRAIKSSPFDKFLTEDILSLFFELSVSFVWM
jgi:hypothetical protein